MRMGLAILVAGLSGIAQPSAAGLDPARSEVRFTVGRRVRVHLVALEGDVK